MVDKEKPVSKRSSPVSHHRSVSGKGSATERKRHSQAQRPGTEKGDSSTASVCGKATEKNQMEASLTSGCGAPFWRISAAHGWKRGPAASGR